MKKILGTIIFLLCCNLGHAFSVSYNEPMKRIYILGGLDKDDDI